MQNGLLGKTASIGVAFTILITLLLFSCSTPSSTPTTTRTSTSPLTTTTSPPITIQPQYGGNLKILASGLMGGENYGSPAIAPPWSAMVAEPVVEPLLGWDEKGNLAPFLATGWKWSDDYLSLTLTLQKGVKFHDGTDFNADAVKYNFQIMHDSKTRTEFKTITSMDVIDPYTLRVNLSSFDNQLLADIGTVGGLMTSPTARQKYGDEYCLTHPVGTGAFTLTSYERGVKVKFTKFNDYWQKGKPYLDSIEIDFFADPLTAKMAFLAGEGDVIETVSPVDANELQKTGKYNMSNCVGTLFVIEGDGSHPGSVFSDLRVRQAISYAIDAKSVNDAVGYGFFQNSNQAAYPGLWSYNPDVKGYPYNPQKAKDLLKSAGYPNGFSTKLSYQTSLAYFKQASLIIQQNLKDVGIDLQLDPVDPGKWEVLFGKGWDNQLLAPGILCPTGYSPINTMQRNFSSKATFNPSAFHSSDIDSKVDQAIKEPDQAKMMKLIQDCQKLVFDDYCVATPIFLYNYVTFKTKQIHDIKIFEPWMNYWQPWNAWLGK